MKLILFNTFIIIMNLHAQISLTDCESSAINFNSKTQSATNISNDCGDLIYAQRNSINEDNSIDDYIYITGYKNILYTKEYIQDVDGYKVFNAHRFTAGEETNLKEILAVDFNEGDASVYLLNKVDSDIYLQSFYYDVSGNVTPLKSFTSMDLNYASNLRVNEASKEIFILFKQNATIKIFNKDANPLGKKNENSTNVKRSISGSPTLLNSPQDLAIYNNEIFVLDNDRVLVFNQNDNGAVAPKRVISGSNTQLSGAVRLEINDSNEIEITNGDSSVKRFLPSSSGNSSPLKNN